MVNFLISQTCGCPLKQNLTQVLMLPLIIKSKDLSFAPQLTQFIVNKMWCLTKTSKNGSRLSRFCNCVSCVKNAKENAFQLVDCKVGQFCFNWATSKCLSLLFIPPCQHSSTHIVLFGIVLSPTLDCIWALGSLRRSSSRSFHLQILPWIFRSYDHHPVRTSCLVPKF